MSLISDSDDKMTNDLIERSIRNLSSIIISMLRKHSNDKEIEQLSLHLPLWLLSNDYCLLIKKYNKNSEIEEKLTNIHSKFKKNNDSLISTIHEFNRNLYPSLIGSYEENFNSVKFVNVINWLQQKHWDHLNLNEKISSLRDENLKKIIEIGQLNINIYNSNCLQTNVKTILNEKCKYLQLLRKKLEKYKKIEQIKQILSIDSYNQIDQNNLHEQYRQKTIKNQSIQKEIDSLKRKNTMLKSLNLEYKIKHIKQLNDEIKFVKQLNDSSGKIENHYNISPFNDSYRSSSTIGEISLSFDTKLKF